MRAGTMQDDSILMDSIDHQPIGIEVKFTIIRILAQQGVIAKPGRQ